MSTVSRWRRWLLAITISAVVAGSIVGAGQASAATVSCTISAPKQVKYGDTGSCVTLLQTRLGGLSRDGQFGSLTDAAVRQFQRANGLQVDGQVGPLTWAKIQQGLPAWGTVIYSGTGSLAGTYLYACRNPSNGGQVKYSLRSSAKRPLDGFTGYHFAVYGVGVDRTLFFGGPGAFPTDGGGTHVVPAVSGLWPLTGGSVSQQISYVDAPSPEVFYSFTDWYYISPPPGDEGVSEDRQVSFFPSLLPYCTDSQGGRTPV